MTARGTAVTLIIPTYNYGNFLPDALRSALAQDYEPLEILVVDDGSTDDTADVVKSFGDRILYVYREHGGLAAAKNTGISAAAGEYIGFLDADDELLPGMVSQQAAFLDANPAYDIVTANMECHYPEEDRPKEYANPVLMGKGDADILFPMMFLMNMILGNTVLFRKSLVDRVGPFDEEILFAEDYEFWLRCLERARARYRDVVVAKHRKHGASLTANIEAMRLHDIMILKRFRSNADPRTRKLINARLAQRVLDLGYLNLTTGMISRARRQFAQGLRLDPLSLDLWKLILGTLLPEPVRKSLMKGKT